MVNLVIELKDYFLNYISAWINSSCKNKLIQIHRHLYSNVQTVLFIKVQNFKQPKWAINWWMDKETVVYPYNGILLSNKKQSIGTCYNMDESQNHSARRKRPHTEDWLHTVVFYLHEILERASL